VKIPKRSPQPLLWLFAPVPDQPPGAIPYQPGSFLFLLDLPIALLALAGLPALWKRRVLRKLIIF
jgi:hypothetical protein